MPRVVTAEWEALPLIEKIMDQGSQMEVPVVKAVMYILGHRTASIVYMTSGELILKGIMVNKAKVPKEMDQMVATNIFLSLLALKYSESITLLDLGHICPKSFLKLLILIKKAIII